MHPLKIMVVDDERILRVSIADHLRDKGYEVLEFSNASTALSILAERNIDIVITDIRMPGMDGIEFLSKIKAMKPEVFVVMMTAYASIETAVKAIKLGAYDYLTKPFKRDELMLMIDRIKELRTIKKDNKSLFSRIQSRYDFSSFVGSGESVKQVFELVKIVANTNSTVLITGETGTGKELLTNIIHYNSNRKTKPFIKVSCAILSKDVFESELFGYEKGAFTGAEKTKPGRFELANEGTLYLDDIDDIPLELQVKLLRAIEEQEIERVGGIQTIKIDVRLIASTKRDLKELVQEGKFREDLFYRLNVFPIPLEPLRGRKMDIIKLVRYFKNRFAQGRNIEIEKDALNVLVNYHWPGNVRELKNLVERLVLLASKDNRIDLAKLPYDIKTPLAFSMPQSGKHTNLEEMLAEIEINAIKNALIEAENNKAKAARALGIPASTLRTKIEKYAIGLKLT